MYRLFKILTKRLVSPGGGVHLVEGEAARGHDVLSQGRGEVNLSELVVVGGSRPLPLPDLSLGQTLASSEQLQTCEE